MSAWAYKVRFPVVLHFAGRASALVLAPDKVCETNMT
jgi:hypothetical protein